MKKWSWEGFFLSPLFAATLGFLLTLPWTLLPGKVTNAQGVVVVTCVLVFFWLGTAIWGLYAGYCSTIRSLAAGLLLCMMPTIMRHLSIEWFAPSISVVLAAPAVVGLIAGVLTRHYRIIGQTLAMVGVMVIQLIKFFLGQNGQAKASAHS